MRKILIIESCEGCPYFDMDPNDTDTDPSFWGVPSCLHPVVGIRAMQDLHNVPEWCPLPDAGLVDLLAWSKP